MNENIRERIESVEKVVEDPQTFNEYKKAIDVITSILDEDVFEYPHFLYHLIRDYETIIKLSKSLESFEKEEGFRKEIKPRLKKKSQFYDTKFELETAYWIKKKGNVSVKFIKRQTENEKKTPDLLIDSIIPLELKNLHPPDHISEQRKYFNDISNFLDNHRESCKSFGKIHRPIAEKEKEKIIEEISSKIDFVKNENKIIIVENTTAGKKDYEFLLAPIDKQDRLEELSKERELSRGLSGPPQKRGEIYRIREAIKDKIKQIPQENPGAIYIKSDFLTFRNEKEELLEITRYLVNRVYEWNRLTSLIIEINPGAFKQKEIVEYSKEDIRITEFSSDEYLAHKSFLIIHNKFSEESKKQRIIDKIFALD